jgi:tetratricopeptide (TPR) repeat protein
MLKMPSAFRFLSKQRYLEFQYSGFPYRGFRYKLAIATLAGAIALGSVAPAWAGDPFRATNPHGIDDQTEAAFEAIFKQGDYRRAADLLRSPNASEPLSYAMKASLDYVNENWDSMGENATRTRETAEQLVATDPLRGHLYTAVGQFLEGAHTFSTQDRIRATPAVLGKLQQVFENLDAAEQVDPNDPEFNLLKGYMDLILAVNLPFSNPQQAIDRLRDHAAPTYLAERGIALGYRDLGQSNQALTAVNQALQDTPDNPDLLYLKAQILVLQSKYSESLPFFQQALVKPERLFPSLLAQIFFEQCRTMNRVNPQQQQNCDALRDGVRTSGNLPAATP